ncbi:hypothetical protein [Halomarina oriensis]|uniref:DUF7975 domain-containing protein n=1 Tax=Halomarina oriensis TaxID=671145 RepID=A0A6B0GTX7_9EURY|nr:hypothetical protein [Halomarina oriensis]MWG35168.1 hypothetical protein [Halomarina oriensis]
MSDTATTPHDRLVLFVRTVTAQRTGTSDGDEGVGFATSAGRLRYDDRTVVLDCSSDERERLDALLAEYPVFKVKQPETRKAPEGTVVLSAIADAKHLGDFLESVFREVFGASEDYELRVTE